MEKIVYVSNTEITVEPLIDIAAEEGIEIIPAILKNNATEDELKEQSLMWKEMGVSAILCRGSSEVALRNMSADIPVLPLQFSFESTVFILQGYGQEHPDFFGKVKRKVLMVSTRPLLHDFDLLGNMFNIEVANLHGARGKQIKEMERVGKDYDLVICGLQFVEPLREKGVNAYYHRSPDIQTIHENLRVAKAVIMAQRGLREKNEVIQSLLNNSFHAILTIDREGRVQNGNGQLRRHFQCDLQELLGKDICELLPNLKREVIEGAFELERGFYGEPVELKGRILVMNGFPISSGGALVGMGIHFEELKQIQRIEQKVQSELNKKGLVAKYTFQDILGASPAIHLTKQYAEGFAMNEANVLIYGESGSGKELFAQSIHNQSLRKEGPFVALNCGALPQNLLESELFGYVGGAFTGAAKGGKKGLLELANKGTIFLDEISEMDPLGQVRLLRVLEERVITRVGDERVIPVDLRIIAASNKNLRKLVEEGKFREDLYYRLNVLMLKIPPLRERAGDVRLLGQHFLRHFGDRNKKWVELEEDAWAAMERFPWKGNVRQLRNFCERLVIIANRQVLSGRFILRQLNENFFESFEPVRGAEEREKPDQTAQHGVEVSRAIPGTAAFYKEAVLEEEKIRIRETLNRVGGNREAAAKLLGMSKTSLWRRMKKYGIGGIY